MRPRRPRSQTTAKPALDLELPKEIFVDLHDEAGIYGEYLALLTSSRRLTSTTTFLVRFMNYIVIHRHFALRRGESEGRLAQGTDCYTQSELLMRCA